MLVSDKYGFIIACPTKTGTTSLQAAVQAWCRLGGAGSVLRVLRGESETKHRMAPPAGLDGYDRYIVVRDPADRLCSMYEWLRRKPVDEPIGRFILDAERHSSRRGGMAAWLECLSAYRSAPGYLDDGHRKYGARRPYMWTDTQATLVDYCHGIDAGGGFLDWYSEKTPDLLETEHLERDWVALWDSIGPDEDELFDLSIKQLNSTRGEARLATDAAGYRALLGASHRRLFDHLVAQDVVWS